MQKIQIKIIIYIVKIETILENYLIIQIKKIKNIIQEIQIIKMIFNRHIQHIQLGKKK